MAKTLCCLWEVFSDMQRGKRETFLWPGIQCLLLISLLYSHANWFHNLCALACDFGHKWVGQTGEVRDKIRLFTEAHYCTGIEEGFFLSSVLDTVLRGDWRGQSKSLNGSLNGQAKSQGNFTWAVTTLAHMEDAAGLMRWWPKPEERSVTQTLYGIVYLQPDSEPLWIDSRLSVVLHSASKLIYRADTFWD